MIQEITQSQAFYHWNKFTFELPSLVPFSFNPSLFNFYRKYFNWKPYYILIFDSNKVLGVLPVVFTERSWVSVPHFSYGGYLSSGLPKNLSVETLMGLIDGLVHYDSGFYILDIKDIKPALKKSSSRLFIRSFRQDALNSSYASEKVSSIIQLPLEKEILWDSLNHNLKRKIRKAKKNDDLSIEIGSFELLDDFFYVYEKNIRQLKSLNFNKKFFADLMNCWDYGSINIFVAYHNNLPVGATMLASYMGFFENMFFATISDFRRHYISDYLNWEMITYSIIEKNDELSTSNKESVYSFGRSSDNSGVYKYKNHWPVTNYRLYNYQNFFDIRKKNWLYYMWGKLPNNLVSYLSPKLIKHIY